MIILGLGSNKGDRLAYLQKAVDALREWISDLKCSSVYTSKALLTPDAPPEWNKDYFNMAVCGETQLAPHALLAKLKEIEQYTGRMHTGYWGPREIDIDILAYHDVIMNETDLIIPHRFLLERDFALIPLTEIAGNWVHPVKNVVISEYAIPVESTVSLTGFQVR